jgi:hypothetical protein
MSETPDPLESELSALRPREVSPGFQQRVTERLAMAPRTARRRWWFAVAGGLAAACLLVALLWGSRWRIEVKPTIPRPQPTPVAEAEDAGPSLRAYRSALARSPAQLDALLDKHALVAPDTNPQLAGAGAFTRPDAALHALLGEP